MNKECLYKTIRKPNHCSITVLKNCMLKCMMCRNWKHTSNPNETTAAELKRFIDQLRDMSSETMEINFTGGEPLLKEGIIDLIEHCAKAGFKTQLVTSAYLINQEIAKKIAAAGLNFICISIDSLNEEKHDSLRGVKGVYGKAMAAIEQLDRYRNNQLNLGIQTTIMGPNLDEILPLTEWVHNDHRLSMICFQAIAQPGNTPSSDKWYTQDEYKFLWPQDTQHVDFIINELIRLNKLGYRMSNPIGQLHAFKSYFKDPERFIKRQKCNKGDHVLNIDDEGNLYLCYDKGFLGNIRDKDMAIDKLWYSRRANAIRESIDRCQENCGMLINCFFEEEIQC